MDVSLKNVTEGRITSRNARNVTRRVKKRISAGRNKNTRKKNKIKRIMSLKIYI